jgi:hypothetical protein
MEDRSDGSQCLGNQCHPISFSENRTQGRGDDKGGTENLVPRHLLEFREVFLQGKQTRKTLPISRPFDYEIKLKEGFVLKNCKIYPLNPQEMERMKLFIKENLASGFIQISKSPQASLSGKRRVTALPRLQIP